MHRRRFLGALLAACGSQLVTLPARAASSSTKIRRIEKEPCGTTFRLALEHAPFPCGGSPYTDSTVFVFVPRHYRAPDDQRLDAVVHFHGHNTTAERTLAAHALREQLYDSKQNAILVVPQGAVLAAESGVGKLAKAGGLRRLMNEIGHVLAMPEAQNALDRAATSRDAVPGTLCLSAHSGGYTSVASAITHGGLPVHEVYLFDALYGELVTYRDWVLSAKDARGRSRHKLVSFYAGELVRTNNLALLAALEARGVECLHEAKPPELSRAQIAHGRAVFLRSRLSHTGVTHELNGLRDCLFASCLHRRLDTDWFENACQPRPLDPRPPSG
jgi:hypothetical protein